jgi:hypothetical protein
LKDLAAISGSHTVKEPVAALVASFLWLIGALWHSILT